MDHGKLARLVAEGIFWMLACLAVTALGVHAGGIGGTVLASVALVVASIYGGVTAWMLLTAWRLR